MFLDEVEQMHLRFQSTMAQMLFFAKLENVETIHGPEAAVHFLTHARQAEIEVRGMLELPSANEGGEHRS